MARQLSWHRSGKTAEWVLADGASSGCNRVLWTVPPIARQTGDILVASDTGVSGGYVAYAAYSARGLKPRLFLDPAILSGVTVTGAFENSCKAMAIIADTLAGLT